MRRNKLYSANKWNQPAFMGGRNLFDDGGSLAAWNSLAQADKAANPWNYADDVDTTQQYMNSTNFLGLAKKDNPFSKGNIAGGLGSMAKTSIGSGVLGAAGSIVGGAAYKGLSGGLNSGAGSAINSIGSTVGGVVSNFNPLLGAAVSAASGIIGGGVNALVGTKVDQEKLNRANGGTAAYNNFASNAGSFDAVQGPVAQANVQNAYKGGVFKKGWAKRRNDALRQERADARQFAFNSVDNNVSNITDDQMNDALANYAAFGGPLFGTGDDDMGAINYGFMQDYLTQKKQAAEARDKISGITPMPAFMNSYADGGSFRGSGAGGSWDTEEQDTYKVKNFNQAFDKAVKDGLKEFIFQGRRYNTKKENNPIREFNNRWVGEERLSNVKHPSKAYDHDEGPLGGPLSDIPLVTDTYIGSPERPPRVEFNPEGGKTDDLLESRGLWNDIFFPSYIPRRQAIKKALGGDIQSVLPQDNTRVNRTVPIPIERKRNFTDSDYFWGSGWEYPAGLWKHKDGTFHTSDDYGDDVVFTQEEADSLVRANRERDKRRKTRNAMREAVKEQRQRKYDLGGDIQTNSADFTTGLMHIDAGGSHEENPYEGVQLGVDNEGVPNLVEEGETVFNDYVYSKRILCDEETKKIFHLPKKKDITFADLSKKLEKESSERPNDPISQAGLEAQMERLAEQQERQKQEMEAERAKAAFEAMSPEEQAAVMQQVEAQQQAAQQAELAAQQQAATPEEQAMAEQQAMMANGSNAMLGEEPQLQACGGRINRYDDGGVLKFLRQLGFKSAKDAEKAGWKPSDFGDFNDWNSITEDSAFGDDFDITKYTDRITSPEMKAAISMGYRPGTKRISRRWYEPFGGNSVGWTESYSKDALNAQEFKEYADRYKNTLGWALNNGIIKAPEEGKTISTQEVMEAMKQAPDWQNTDKWLRANRNNLAKYIGDARSMTGDNDVKFRDKWSKFGDFTQNEDGTWNYALRNNLTDEEGKAFEDLFWKGRGDSKIGVMYNSFTDPNENNGNYLIDDDGNVTRLWDTSGYEKVGNPWDWSDEDSLTNNSATFYRAKPNADGNTGGNGDAGNVAPKHRAEWMRYAGLFGPAVGLGMQMAGIGKPDTASLDAAIEGAGDAYLAGYKPLGNYLRYNPMDIWYEQNALNAQSRATDRALANASGANRGTAMAGLVANGYNSQLASGDLYRKALEYNDAQRQRVADFNRGTDQFNAEAYNRTAQFNADALNRASQAAAQLKLQAASQKMDADAGWNQGIYGNVAGLFKGLSDLGRENAQWNMVSDMWADGLAGTATEKTNSARGHLKSGTSSAKGGKIKRRRGSHLLMA